MKGSRVIPLFHRFFENRPSQILAKFTQGWSYSIFCVLRVKFCCEGRFSEKSVEQVPPRVSQQIK